MLHAFIIDDDRYAIEAVYSMIPWQQLNTDKITKISSSTGLVERILEEKPDLVFIDIELYKVSGISIIRECHEKNFKPLFVIVSGHDDFEYAKAAVSLGVAYYLLKPLDPADISLMVNKLNTMLPECNPLLENSDTMWNDINSYIEKNYNKKLTADIICENFFISKRNFFYIVKKFSSLSFNEYLTKIRIESSKNLLTTTPYSIEEIAEKVGYRDIYYFSKIFKTETGLSPKQYRKQNTEEK